MASESIGFGILFLSVVVGLVTILGSVVVLFSGVGSGIEGQVDRLVAVEETELSVVDVQGDEVVVENTGEREYGVGELFVFLDGVVVVEEDVVVAGDGDRELVRPGEEVVFVFDDLSDVESVKVVGPNESSSSYRNV